MWKDRKYMIVSSFFRIFAIDTDEGQNAQLLYNFTEADPRFSVDSDGRIITSESLKENESYQLTVKVYLFHFYFLRSIANFVCTL